MTVQGNFFPTLSFPGGNAPTPFPTASDIPIFSDFSSGSADTFTPQSLLGFPPENSSQAINVVQIDDFVSEKNSPNNKGQFFNHGETVASILEAGGATPELGPDVQVSKLNIDDGGSGQNRTKNISKALDKVILAAQQNPDSVDAVNISQQDAQAGMSEQAIRDKIVQLQNLGIPVVVAADNFGSTTPNQLAPESALVVQSTDANGNILPSSGPGNVRAEARSTSFAAPQVAPMVGYLKKQGYSVDQIQQAMSQFNFFPGVQVPDVYTR